MARKHCEVNKCVEMWLIFCFIWRPWEASGKKLIHFIDEVDVVFARIFFPSIFVSVKTGKNVFCKANFFSYFYK